MQCINKLRAPSRLQQLDTVLHKMYSSGKLDIVRLSGERLPMANCYINLAIVEHYNKDANLSHGKFPTASPFSLQARQKIELPNEQIQTELATAFNERRVPDGEMKQPRRILIRGRAGVGKTTLCKKMVYEFIYHGMWTEMFDRVLWIPLRNLKGRSPAGYNLERLFYDEFFSKVSDGGELAGELWQAIESGDSARNLFILDGLDEVTQLLGDDGDMSSFLDNLLDRNSVIITSRPNAMPPAGLKVDLELETIGFYQDQVRAYLEADIRSKPRADKIQSLLQSNWLLSDLVRIPIQLDALCYMWQETDPDDMSTMPETMAGIYQAIVHKLWIKDAVRLETITRGDAARSPAEIDVIAKHEIALLECLAFNGLCNDTINFTRENRNEVYRYLMSIDPAYNLRSSLDDVLARLSFMRSSDPSRTSTQRNFHFIHLTYQEYFAAQYFQRHVEQGKTLNILFSQNKECKDPGDFLRTHKYTARLDIMWRFVSGFCDTSSYSKRESNDFFDRLGEEPLDLFGPTHQRLVMHCLAEARKSTIPRQKLEDQLSLWLEFECNLGNPLQLSREPEFPGRALNVVLQRASVDIKLIVLSSLVGRQHLPPATFELFTQWLREDKVLPELRRKVLDILRGFRESLPSQIIHTVIMQMNHNLCGVSSVAAKILKSQRALPQEILETLLSQLESDNHNKRGLAIKLFQGQPTPPEAIVSWLDDKNENLQVEALRALGGWPNLPGDVLQLISAQLNHRSERISRSAFDTLMNRSGLPEAVIQALAAWLENQDYTRHDRSENSIFRRTRHHRREDSSNLGKDIIKAVNARVEHRDSVVRQKAMKVLQRQHGLSENTIRAILPRLKDEELSTRIGALEVFHSQRDLPRDVVEAVMGQLTESQNEDLRRTATMVLGSQAHLPAGAFEIMTTWIQNEDESMRNMASQFFQRQIKLPQSVLRTVAVGLNSQDRELKKRTLKNLWELGCGGRSFPHDVLQHILTQLRTQEEDMKIATLHTLDSQALSDDVVEEVAAQLDDESKHVRKEALKVLQAVRARQNFSEGVLRRIVAELDKQDYDGQSHALMALRATDETIFPPDFFPAIETQLLSPDYSCKCHALEALPVGSELPGSCLQVISDQLQKDSTKWTLVALCTLKNRPDLPRSILNATKRKLRSRNPSVRVAAADVFQCQKTLSQGILLALIEQLRDSESDPRRAAVNALRCQPNLDETILPAIIRLLEENNSQTRVGILKVLRCQLRLAPMLHTSLVTLMDGESWRVRLDAVNLLGTESALPEEVLLAVVARMGDESEYVRLGAVDALQRQSVLPDSIVRSKTFYRTWITRSFEEHICCYIEDGVAYLDMPGSLGKVALRGGLDPLKDDLRQIREDMSISPLFS